MNTLRHTDALWLLGRTRGTARLVRVVIVVAPILASIATALAAGSPFFVVTASIVALAVASAIHPDGHLGLVVIGIVAGEWLMRVEGSTNLWSIAVALLLGVYHAALTLAISVPAGAELPVELVRRWVMRASLPVGPAAAVWLGAVLLDRTEIGAEPALVRAALLAVTGMALWTAVAAE